MRRLLSCALVLLVALNSGCGSGRVKAKGRLLQDGRPFPSDEPGLVVHVVFIPLAESNPAAPEGNSVAEFNREDATFRVAGRDGRGLPPGKYRISVQVNRKRKDIFEGAFNAVNSKIVREVTSSADEIVVDLAKPEG
jgi:hypothetical protein